MVQIYQAMSFTPYYQEQSSWNTIVGVVNLSVTSIITSFLSLLGLKISGEAFFVRNASSLIRASGQLLYLCH